MPTWTPDPSFYPSPRQAAKAPPETLAYVAAFDPDRKTADRIAIVDVDPKSASYAKIIGDVVASEVGDEFHHFGWNACSSCLCPNAPHPHGATLSHRPRPALLAHLRSGYQAKPARTQN